MTDQATTVTATAVLDKAAPGVAAAAVEGLVPVLTEAGVAPAMAAEAAKGTEEAVELVPAMDLVDQVAARGATVQAADQAPAHRTAVKLPTLRAKVVPVAAQTQVQGHGVAAALDPDTTRLRPLKSFEIWRPAVTVRAVRVQFSWKAQ